MDAIRDLMLLYEGFLGEVQLFFCWMEVFDCQLFLGTCVEDLMMLHVVFILLYSNSNHTGYTIRDIK